MLSDFGEAMFSFLLAVLATYPDNVIWGKKADLHHDGGIM